MDAAPVITSPHDASSESTSSEPSDPEPTAQGPASERTTVRRGAHRAVYDREAILSIIQASPICHVAVSTPEGPLVLPMSHGCDGERIFLHGAPANSVLNWAVEGEACVTFTLIDGFVFGRSAFFNSVNYRSVVVRGRAERLEGEAKVTGLRLIADHVAPTWDAGRPPTASEIRRTRVVAISLAEASAKVRTGDPSAEEADLDGPWWAGTVAVELQAGPAIASHDLAEGVAVPSGIRDLAGRPLGVGRSE